MLLLKPPVPLAAAAVIVHGVPPEARQWPLVEVAAAVLSPKLLIASPAATDPVVSV